MIYYDDIFYSNIPGGLFDGILAINLELGSKLKVSLEDLTNSILKFGKTLALHISGSDSHSTPEDIMSMIKIMRDNNYQILGSFLGSERPPWMDYVTYRIVTITEEPWLSYAANEIHFQPNIKVDIKSPLLQAVHQNSILYIDSHRDILPRELFDFIMRFNSFRVYSTPSRVYRMPIEVISND